jgi:hypothetical protein
VLSWTARGAISCSPSKRATSPAVSSCVRSPSLTSSPR